MAAPGDLVFLSPDLMCHRICHRVFIDGSPPIQTRAAKSGADAFSLGFLHDRNFLKAVFPEPSSLGGTTKGKTNIGVIATGLGKDGKEKTLYLYNICDHEDAYAETGNQAVSYTTGVPAMIGAAMMVTGTWGGAGVFNMEQMDPDPFMDMLMKHGLPWQVKELDAPLDF